MNNVSIETIKDKKILKFIDINIGKIIGDTLIIDYKRMPLYNLLNSYTLPLEILKYINSEHKIKFIHIKSKLINSKVSVQLLNDFMVAYRATIVGNYRWQETTQVCIPLYLFGDNVNLDNFGYTTIKKNSLYKMWHLRRQHVKSDK